MVGGIPQPDLAQSIWAPHSPPQLSQGGNYYPEGNQDYIPQPNNPYGQPQYMIVPQGNYYSTNPMYNVGNNMMDGL